MSNSEIKKRWETTVFKDPDSDSDDLMIEFPPDLLEDLGWKIGDSIDFAINKEGSGAILTKVNIDNESTSSK